jgi:hypothetical protein
VPVIHRAASVPGSFYGSQQFSVCGLNKQRDKAKITPRANEVTCPDCRAKISEQRAAAKARLAEIEGR